MTNGFLTLPKVAGCDLSLTSPICEKAKGYGALGGRGSAECFKIPLREDSFSQVFDYRLDSVQNTDDSSRHYAQIRAQRRLIDEGG